MNFKALPEPGAIRCGDEAHRRLLQCNSISFPSAMVLAADPGFAEIQEQDAGISWWLLGVASDRVR